MQRERPALSVVDGDLAGVRIAQSLVHARERIDIPVRDVRKIEPLAEQTFFFSDTWMSKTYPMPHVRLEFAPHVGARIHRLTSQIVGQELAIMVAGEIVSRPIVREPRGLRETMCISVHDIAAAEELAAKLREGWVVPNLRLA